MEALQLDREKLLKRVKYITSLWSWQFDALVLVTGKTSDDAAEYKAIAMHHFLLGIEFPDTALAILRTGTLVFLTSPKKVEILRQVEGPGVELIPRAAQPQAGDAAQTRSFEQRVKGDKATARVGMLLKERHVGPWAEACVAALSSCKDFEVVECREEISEVLAVKDNTEIQACERASFFAQLFMQTSVVKNVETIIDQDLRVRNRDVCAQIEAETEKPDFLKAFTAKYAPDHALDPGELEVIYVSVQSGSGFDLKPAAEPSNDEVPMQGTYLLSVGVKYMEYSACVTRTILVDPIKLQIEAYHMSIEVHTLVLACLKPGVLFKDVYIQARKLVEKKHPVLSERFVKNVGFSMGLEFKDHQMVLSEKSERKVAPGMVFCVSVGFCEVDSAAKPWAVWVCDTVVILPQGSTPPCRVLTEASSKRFEDVVYELDADDEVGKDSATKQLADAVAAAPNPSPPAPTLPTKDVAPKAAGKAKAKAKAAEKKAAPPAKKQPEPRQTIEKNKEPVKGKQPEPRQTIEKNKEPVKEKQPEPRQSIEKNKEPVKEKAQLPKKQEEKRTKPDDARKRSSESYVSGAAEALQKKRAAKQEQAKKEMQAQIDLEQNNERLRVAKLEELMQRFSGSSSNKQVSNVGTSKLYECKAYNDAGCLPANLRPNRLHIDVNAEALLAPICGAIVPFHLRTIKNMSRHQNEKLHMLRVNFFTPGSGKSLDDYPTVNGQRVYVKELTFRSQTAENLDKILHTFKEASKRSKQRDIEGEVRRGEERSGIAEAQPLQVSRNFPCLRDLSVRPSPGGRGRATGTLEAHVNGFRFSMRGGADKVDILYSRIQHAILQPCEEGSLLVIIHFHFKEAMMIGKKKSQDLQFFAEAGNLTEDLNVRKAGNAHDPDEILEEQREREWKDRLNQLFLDFTKKVQAISTCPLKFDVPFWALRFNGVPFKTQVMLCPCERALVNLSDWPPFCLDLASIDVAIFERYVPQLKEFDLAFVLKDYSQQPIRVTTIPTQRRDVLRGWLNKLKVPMYDCKMNLQWPVVMKQINSDIQGFLEEGGWNAWFVGVDDEDEGSDDDEAEDDFRSEDMSQDSDADDSDGAWEPSDLEESDPGESEPSDGESWDELERQAERSDKKRDAEKLAKRTGKDSQPPAKRKKVR